MRSASKILLRLPLKNVFACPLCPACGQPVASRRCAVRRQRSLDRLVAHRCDGRSAIPLKGGRSIACLWPEVVHHLAPTPCTCFFLPRAASDARLPRVVAFSNFENRMHCMVHSPSALVGRPRSPVCVVRSSRMGRPTFRISRASGGCSLAEVLLHHPTS